LKTSLLILAAGMGSRYGGLKQLDAIGPFGETLMDYSIYDAKRAGFNKVVFVIRKSLEKDFIKKVFPKYQGFIEVDYVFQEINNLPDGFKLPNKRSKPWGTAHAVLVAKSKIKENFAVINADDYYGVAAYQRMFNFLQNNTPKYGLVTYELNKTTSLNGTVSRGICELDTNDFLINIVEHTHIIEENNKVYSVLPKEKLLLDTKAPTSMNFMGFNSDIFSFIQKQFILFLEQHIYKEKSEFFLPDILASLIESKNEKIQCIPTNEQWFGVTYAKDKQRVLNQINKKIKEGIYPNKLY
jgi:NDP-sugar pyrophosphorylase family protein